MNMGKNKPISKNKGLFNHETLKVQFGGALSKPEYIYEADAIKVPDYKYMSKESRDAGGGCYYQGTEMVERIEKNEYIIVRDGKLIGVMTPYYGNSIKSDLWVYPVWPYRITDVCKLNNIEI